MRSQVAAKTEEACMEYAPIYMTTAELAALVRAPESTVRFWRHRNVGPRGVRIGKRVLYLESDVLAWLDEQTTGSRPAAS